MIGSGGVKASEAMKSGALKLIFSDGGKGISAEITAYLANVTAGGKMSSSNDGPQMVGNILVVPDGNGTDGKIYGSVVMAVKSGTTQNTGSNTSTGTGTGNTGNQTGAKSSSGGGGCAGQKFSMILPALLLMLRRKR